MCQRAISKDSPRLQSFFFLSLPRLASLTAKLIDVIQPHFGHEGILAKEGGGGVGLSWRLLVTVCTVVIVLDLIFFGMVTGHINCTAKKKAKACKAKSTYFKMLAS